MSEDSSRAVWLQQARSDLRRTDPVLGRLIDDRPAFDPRAWLARLPPMDLYGACPAVPGHRPAAVPPGDPPHAGPYPGLVRRLSPCPRRTGGRRPRPALPGRLVLAEGQHASRPGRADNGRPAEPGRAEHPAGRRAHGRAHRHPRDRPLDRAGRPAHRAAARGRRPAGRPGAPKAVYQLDHLPGQQEVLAIAAKWRPYRSLATSYLFSAAFEPAEVPAVARLGSA